jgi:hypothetical protein
VTTAIPTAVSAATVAAATISPKVPTGTAPACAAPVTAKSVVPVVTAPARQFGVARTTTQRRLKTGWVPPAQVPRKPHAAVPAPAAPVLRDTTSHAVAVAPAAPVATLAMLTAVLAFAACSVSIYGLTSIFVGAFWPIVGMGAALELGKLSAVAYLGQRYGALPVRLTLLALVSALKALNSIGVFGFLSRAHIAQTVTAAARVDGKAADVDARIMVQ